MPARAATSFSERSRSSGGSGEALDLVMGSPVVCAGTRSAICCPCRCKPVQSEVVPDPGCCDQRGLFFRYDLDVIEPSKVVLAAARLQSTVCTRQHTSTHLFTRQTSFITHRTKDSVRTVMTAVPKANLPNYLGPI